MRCILCKELLDVIPIYNEGKDEDYPSSFLLCNNKACGRFGLLTVTYSNTEDETTDKDGEHKEVQSGDVLLP